MIIKWKYICTQLTETYYRGVLGSRYNIQYLVRSWKSLFDFSIDSYHDTTTMGENYAIFFNMFSTISQYEGFDEKEKVHNIYLLLDTIVGEFNYELVAKIFSKGGYTEDLPLDDSSNILSHHGKFHPNVIKASKTFFEQKHYSIAVNESCKLYIAEVQYKSGLNSDGENMMMQVFGKNGKLTITNNLTESEKILMRV